MKKLLVMMSLAMILGIFTVQAQDKKQEVKKPASTEQIAAKSGNHAKDSKAAKTSAKPAEKPQAKPAENSQTKKTK
jgi:hypothetical protein